MFDQALIILLGYTVVTTLIVIFLSLIFYQLVFRHLITITTYISSIKFIQEHPSLVLSRKERSPEKNDELDVLVSAINLMQVDLKNGVERLQASEYKLLTLIDTICSAPILASLF